jgi:hypothetical protein
MKKTQEVLGQLVNYPEVIAMDLLSPPKIEKADVPKYITCPQYSKAQEKLQRTVERHNEKISLLDQRLKQSENEISSLKGDLAHWQNQVGKGVGTISRMLVNREDASAVESYNRDVARHNDAIEQVRRYEERISNAIDKHNELVERKKDALAEAKTQIESLQEEALGVIDDDIVTFLDKCFQQANKLDDTENIENYLTAIEISFIALKVNNTVKDYIDTNTAREKSREYLQQINKMLSTLTGKELVRNAFVDIYRNNIDIAVRNADLLNQVKQIIGKISQEELDRMTKSIDAMLKRKYRTIFEYKGIVDPVELDKVVQEITKTINLTEADIAEVKKLAENTQKTAESGVFLQQQVETLLAAIEKNTEESRDILFTKGHFVVDMMLEDAVNDFYNKELRPAMVEMRKHVINAAGEEKISILFTDSKDRYSIERTKEAIKQANLLRLQNQRDQIGEYISYSTNTIPNMKRQIDEAEQVPNQNSKEFRSSTSLQYTMTCIPLFGFISALSISGKIKSFSPAFRSNNQVYRELAAEVLVKNNKMKMVNTIIFINIIAALILGQANKRLQTYLGN